MLSNANCTACVENGNSLAQVMFHPKIAILSHIHKLCDLAKKLLMAMAMASMNFESFKIPFNSPFGKGILLAVNCIVLMLTVP